MSHLLSAINRWWLMHRITVEKIFAFQKLWVFLIIFISTTASAYFEVPEDASSTGLINLTDSRHEIKGRNRKFALVGNDDAASFSGRSYVTPSAGNFVPVDLIPVNQPLSISMKRSIRPDNALGDMLYANLKLKTLMEEYTQLQIKSAGLLAGLSVPGMDTKIAVNTSGFATGQTATSKRQALDSAYQSVVRHFGPRIDAGNGQSNRAGTGMASTLPALTAGPRATGDMPYSWEEYKAVSMADGSVMDSGPNMGGEKPIGGGPRDDSLPWIFDVALKIIKWLVSNKIEAIILAASMILIVLLFASLGRRW